MIEAQIAVLESGARPADRRLAARRLDALPEQPVLLLDLLV